MTSKMTPSSKKLGVASLFKQIQTIIFWETLVWQRVPQIDCSWKKAMFQLTNFLASGVSFFEDFSMDDHLL